MTVMVPPTMRAAVLHEPGRMRIAVRPVPRPGKSQVLVRIGSVGICGSDMHFYRHGRLGNFVVEGELVLGHEAGGTIVDVGEGVDPRRVGERVALEPQDMDLTHEQSREGQYNLAPGCNFFGAPGTDGAFQEFVTLPAWAAHPIPDSLSDDDAALVEPASVALHAIKKVELRVGQRVLITGAGPIGVLTAKLAAAAGATEVAVADIDAARARRALAHGATQALHPDDIAPLGRQFDVCIDASGAESAVRAGIGATRPGGAVVLVGVGATDMRLPVVDIMNNELRVTGTYRYRNTWPAAISLIANGRVDLSDFVTARFPLQQISDAFECSSDSASLKVIVRPGE